MPPTETEIELARAKRQIQWMWLLILGLLAGLAIALVVKSGNDSSKKTVEAGTARGTSTTEASTTTTTAGLTSTSGATGGGTTGTSDAGATSAALADGRHFGYVKDTDSSAKTVSFDLAEFLTGNAAATAASEDGKESPPPNDYYIRNKNPKLRTLRLADGVVIKVIDRANCCDRTVDVPRGDFLSAFHEAGDQPEYRHSPFWLTIQGGVVTKVEEQYLP